MRKVAAEVANGGDAEAEIEFQRARAGEAKMDVGIDQAGDCPQPLAFDGFAISRGLGVRLLPAVEDGERAVLNEDRRVLLGRGAGAIDEGDVGDE